MRVTNYSSSFHHTLQERVLRLVRRALPFFKKLTHHIAAIKAFMWTWPHITVDTFGNFQFHIFLLELLILQDLQEANFVLPHEISFI